MEQTRHGTGYTCTVGSVSGGSVSGGADRLSAGETDDEMGTYESMCSHEL